MQQKKQLRQDSDRDSEISMNPMSDDEGGNVPNMSDMRHQDKSQFSQMKNDLIVSEIEEEKQARKIDSSRDLEDEEVLYQDHKNNNDSRRFAKRPEEAGVKMGEIRYDQNQDTDKQGHQSDQMSISYAPPDNASMNRSNFKNNQSSDKKENKILYNYEEYDYEQIPKIGPARVDPNQQAANNNQNDNNVLQLDDINIEEEMAKFQVVKEPQETYVEEQEGFLQQEVLQMMAHKLHVQVNELVPNVVQDPMVLEDFKAEEVPLQKRKKSIVQSFRDLQWPPDADNGLSYSKMQNVIDNRHPRKRIGDKKRPYGCCTTTGWHCCCKSVRKSSIREMGPGMTVYFKSLKFMICLFFWFSFLSIPAYFFYYTGNAADASTSNNSIKYYLSALSLGNIGQAQEACSYYNLTTASEITSSPVSTTFPFSFGTQTNYSIQLYCSFGVMTELKQFGLYVDGTSCPKNSYDSLLVDSDCNMNTMGSKYTTLIKDEFTNDCYGEASCTYNFTKIFFNTTCQSELYLRIQSSTYGQPLVYVSGKCSDEVIEIPFVNYSIKRSNLGILVVCLDVAIVLSFIIALLILSKYEDLENKEINQNLLTAEDFAIVIKNLPDKKDYNSTVDLKALLWTHLEGVASKEQHIIKKIDKKSPNTSEIVNIHFGMTGFGRMKILLLIYNDLKQSLREQKRKEKNKDENGKAKHQKIIDNLNSKIDKNVQKFKDYDKNNKDEVINAYVMFRSMEGKERIIKTYNESPGKRCCKKFFCCRSKEYKRKEFFFKWLNVKSAPAPDNILWENLKIGKKEKCCRVFFTTMITLLLIVGAFVLILVGQYYEEQASSYSQAVECPDTVTKEEAYTDQLKTSSDRQGLMHCYCLEDLYSGNANFLYQTFDDGNTYCKSWFQTYSLSNAFVYLISFGISFLNTILKAILRLLAQFESQHTKTQEIFSSMSKMFIVSFINTGLVIFVANANLGINIESFPIFAGSYSEFTVDWYRVVGSTICLTMIINVVSPHFANSVFLGLKGCFKCCDRGCTCNKKRTKKLLQEDYEDMNTGGEFLLEFRYSQIVATFYIIFMYSSGMPLLYIIAFFTFLCTYWIDKISILKCYRKPPTYSIELPQQAIDIMKFCLIPHFFIGLYMYSNSSILTPTELGTNIFYYVTTSNKYFSQARFSNIHCAIFIAAFVFVVVIFIIKDTLYLLLKGCIRCCCGFKKIQDFSLSDVISNDLYEELTFLQLFKEYEKTRDEISQYEQSMKHGEYRLKFEDDIVKFQSRLESKMSNIRSAFKVRFFNDHKNVSDRDFNKVIVEILKDPNFVAKSYTRYKSLIYSYDFKDNELYYGVQQVERLFLRDQDNESKFEKKDNAV